ncbi:unnamed protein product [Urochloa humidicola]
MRRDVELHVLGVGAFVDDAVDNMVLHFVNPRDEQAHIKPLLVRLQARENNVAAYINNPEIFLQ